MNVRVEIGWKLDSAGSAIRSSRWDTADAPKFKVPSSEHLEMSKGPSLKPAVGQNVALRASLAAGSCTVLFSALPFHVYFPPIPTRRQFSFNCISFHKFSRQLRFLTLSFGLISV